MLHGELDQIGKYKVQAQVGEGAMGIVYRALDPVLNRTVAIKVMSESVARDEALRGRFLREAQAAGSLQHPNVITIYDFGEVEGHLFIAMEFVEGQDLHEVMARGVPLPLGEKLDIMIDVLNGLDYAHKRGVVHRDIKPANIRVKNEGRAQIMDFGIAHLSSSNMTRTGVMVGTPAYMAPEQITGGPISPATDLFAVGAVMYELLTSVKPFRADTLQGVMYKIVATQPEDLRTVAPDLPHGLSDVVQRALAKEPAERYPTAMEMAAAVSEVRSALDRPPTLPKRLSLRQSVGTALTNEREDRAREKKKQRIVTGTLAAVAIAAVSFAVFAIMPKGGAGPIQSADAGASSKPDSAQIAVAAKTTLPPPTLPGDAAAQRAAPVVVAGAPASQRAPSAAARPPAAGGDRSSPTAEEIAAFRTLQAAAIQARRRASDAGATPVLLDVGDEHNRNASALILQGKATEAGVQITLATTAWGEAEREAAARAAAARAAAAIPRAAVAPARDSGARPETLRAPPPAAVTKAPTPPPLPAAVGVASAPVAVDPAPEIRAAVAAYARAIESRDIAAVRGAYSAISPAQAQGFQQFFGSVRSLAAKFAVTIVSVEGATAEVRVSGAYEFVTTAGRNERQPVSFASTLRRGSTGWTITSIR
jgi:serine/threonine protein kinase